MKNRYDYLKSKFSAWLRLKNKTGNVYNPITNTFNLSEEEWQLEIKSNKHAETFRRSLLPFPDLCIQLFESETSTGIAGWEPSLHFPVLLMNQPNIVCMILMNSIALKMNV